MAQNNQNQVQTDYLIDELLQEMIRGGAGDLHITTGLAPTVNISGLLSTLKGFNVLQKEQVMSLIIQLLSEDQVEILYKEKEMDALYQLNENARFRVNAYFERGNLAATIRLIPQRILTLEELHLPPLLYEFCKLPQGLVLITGASGTGKSSTVAAMINWINQNRSVHIVTVEDPIEYMFKSDKALIHQREMHIDTLSWENAIRSTLRENADVIFIGEIRDYKVMALAISAAEAGHLVFSTLHTYSAEQTVERIIGIFPEILQKQVKMQLSGILEGVVTQSLIKTTDGKERLPAVEIMISTQAVKNTIREGNTHFLRNIINTTSDIGMVSMERSLADLVTAGKITMEEALTRTLNPSEVIRYVKGN
ncbi:type IV pili twitching motility protein PilT [candidate division WWE3 bacterium CG_4_9_14_3_um_filter_34_6]|uniref:Type IV pili twitching motility protein PilT n=1 Tax=candidate division WWE3 bacterium CG_4_9_14_3_um_filter_34_6 TaxID=1975079 RepID=A0A2M7X500_UNCKA|nr:MAG: type IV pili twitching motility protein PilT [candidate division WWE3 bacterium CG_4_9_14_3_um_filter_34_6]